MSDEIGKLIAYRQKRSQDSLEEAKILAKAGHWNAAVNRLYYACFYSVSALLAKSGPNLPPNPAQTCRAIRA